mmetsp:Transcript_63658/g.75328  ORF Transcript_63658/g.75328 Transcript_63658/m.75328 type:complete len:284 (-) Transcript_63658:67-918(-)
MQHFTVIALATLCNSVVSFRYQSLYHNYYSRYQVSFVKRVSLKQRSESLNRSNNLIVSRHYAIIKNCNSQQGSSERYIGEFSTTMPRGVKKENLPTKICVTCGRSFNWRKKWERVWDEVTTCSKSCNKKRKENKTAAKHNDADVMNDLDKEGASEITFFETMPTEDGVLFESDTGSNSTSLPMTIDVKAQHKMERKSAKKAMKAARRAQREGRGVDPTAGQKQCSLCQKSVNLLIRCTVDESGAWKMVCGKCWNDVSGGVVDGDDQHPHYRYGGLWKNRRAVK